MKTTLIREDRHRIVVSAMPTMQAVTLELLAPDLHTVEAIRIPLDLCGVFAQAVEAAAAALEPSPTADDLAALTV